MKKTSPVHRPAYRLLLQVVCCLLWQAAAAQGAGIYVPQGGSVGLGPNTSLTIWSDTLLLQGSLRMHDSSSVVTFRGKAWVNDPAAALSGGRVVMQGTSLQSIAGGGSYGSGPAFGRLDLDNEAGVYLHGSHLRVDSGMNFSKGILLTGTNDLILGAAAQVSHHDSSFASTYEGGAVAKQFGADGAFTFPVGTTFSALAYNPLNLDVRAAGWSAASFVKVSLADSVHHALGHKHKNHAMKSWIVRFENMQPLSVGYHAQYSAQDGFVGDTALISGSYFGNNQWHFGTGGMAIGRGGKAISGTLAGNADIFGQDRTLLVKAKALLEGPWNGTAMETTLNRAGLLPLAQPYGTAPYNGGDFNYPGVEARRHLPDNAVDWVLAELRATPSGPAIAKAAGLIMADGTIVDGYADGPMEFMGVPDGDYYFVLRHRNHLAAVSARPITFPNSDAYDFSGSMAAAYGAQTPMAAIRNGKFGLHQGNVVPDAAVRGNAAGNTGDLDKILETLGDPIKKLNNVYSAADVNMDGTVRATGLPQVNDYFKVLYKLGNILLIIGQGF